MKNVYGFVDVVGLGCDSNSKNRRSSSLLRMRLFIIVCDPLNKKRWFFFSFCLFVSLSEATEHKKIHSFTRQQHISKACMCFSVLCIRSFVCVVFFSLSLGWLFLFLCKHSIIVISMERQMSRSRSAYRLQKPRKWLEKYLHAREQWIIRTQKYCEKIINKKGHWRYIKKNNH